MKGELRLRLPPLAALGPDAAVAWAWLQRGEVTAHGSDPLRALGERHPGATAVACVDVQDLILLDLLLPALAGRRLEVAMQAEIEALLLEDVAEVAFAHGPQGPDGRVAVAWLGRDAVQQVVATFVAVGLRLQGVYPTPLLLPLKDGQPTLQRCGEHLLVRTARDHGWVQWLGGGNGEAVANQLRARFGADGACAPQWIGDAPPGWPMPVDTAGLPPEQQWSGALPSWSLPLPGTVRRTPWKAVALGVAAALVAALGLQLQTWRMTAHAHALEQDMQQQVRQALPEVGDVVDPILQAQRAVDAAAAQPLVAPEVQRLSATALQAVPEWAGAATRMHYRPGELLLQLDPELGPGVDSARLERWQQALQAHGLSLEDRGNGRLLVSAAGPG
ncbi:MAG: type II secretion system protein GspL [Stenotrophomonas sp.]|uniref:type II secretion system protein GspL n=1 Tax=Stenotrophomonas sp. TaxID=69392 RepID=UPI003D6CD602